MNTVTVRWFDGYLEEFNATEVRFGCDLLFLRLEDGKNRHIPLRMVRWFGMSQESHQREDVAKGEPRKRVYAKTTMETMPGSCNECAFGRRYGCVGDVECRILREYFTGNVEPPYKERPDECPLLEMEEADHGGVAQESNRGD